MEIYQGVMLGILQGLTEFLPVSSSGHLVLGQHLFGITEPVLSFDISLHVGTLVAIGVVFYRDIAALVGALARFARSGFSWRMVGEDPVVRMGMLIVVGSVPTAVLGLVFKKYCMAMFSSVTLVGVMLLLTGTFLWMTRKVQGSGVGIGKVSFRTAVVVGVCQGVAVIPGISRSGATISAGLFLGIDRDTAARFSFLMSLPAILGAEVLSVKESLETGFLMDQATVYGTLAAFVVGYAALVLLMKLVRQGRFYLFAPYCWCVGIVALAAGMI